MTNRERKQTFYRNIRSTVMQFYHLIFVILDASRMNEHIFKASKIYEIIFDESNLFLKRCVHFCSRHIHFGRVVEISNYLLMSFLTRRAHFRRVQKGSEL